MAQVGRFLDFLKKEDGDEAKAWDLFRTSPPGPDEIRSGRNNRGLGKGLGGVSVSVSSGGGSNVSGVSGVSGSGGDFGGDVGGYVGGDKNHDSGTSGVGTPGTGTSTNGASSSSTIRKRSSSSNTSGRTSMTNPHYAGVYGNTIRTFKIPPIASPGLYALPTASLLQLKEQQMMKKKKKEKEKEQKKLDSSDVASPSKHRIEDSKKNDDNNNNNNNPNDKKDEKSNNGDSDDDNYMSNIETNANGYVTPSTLFNHALFTAGFTPANRNEARYYGSSIIRTLEDMFDSDYILDDMEEDMIGPLNVLRNVAIGIKEEEEEEEEEEKDTDDKTVLEDKDKNKGTSENKKRQQARKKRRLLSQFVINQLNEAQALFQKDVNDSDNDDDTTTTQQRQHSLHSLQFEDMVPKSLITQLPESHIAKQKEYIQKVKERERILKEYQNQTHQMEDAMDAYEDSLMEWNQKKEEYEKEN